MIETSWVCMDTTAGKLNLVLDFYLNLLNSQLFGCVLCSFSSDNPL